MVCLTGSGSRLNTKFTIQANKSSALETVSVGYSTQKVQATLDNGKIIKGTERVSERWLTVSWKRGCY